MNLSAAIRTALVEDTGIAAALANYQGTKPVFTRRPAPDDAPFPIIMVSGDIAVDDADGVDDDRPIVTRDVGVYGQNEPADAYVAVEELGWAVRRLFHRRKNVITVDDWHVIDVVARGPRIAPTDDEKTVGRVVSLTVRLARAR